MPATAPAPTLQALEAELASLQEIIAEKTFEAIELKTFEIRPHDIRPHDFKTVQVSPDRDKVDDPAMTALKARRASIRASIREIKAKTRKAEGLKGYDRYLAATGVRGRRGKQGPHLTRQIQRAMMDALREHAAGGSTLPEEMAIEIAYAFDDALRGRVPAIFRQAPKGHPRNSAIEASCIACGVQYVRAARLGRIKDRTARKTVLKAFGHNDGRAAVASALGDSVLKKWLASWPDDPRVHTLSPRTIEILMRASGRHWQANYSMWTRNHRG